MDRYGYSRARAASTSEAQTDEGSRSGAEARSIGEGQIGSETTVESCVWEWEGHRVRYQKAGTVGPTLLLIHGFGANSDHWRKNIPALSSSHQVFALDLLGYGFSSKPSPSSHPPNSLYSFDTWARQVADFIEGVIGEPTFLACNSIGCVVGLQSSLSSPSLLRGLFLLNVSLRLLHTQKQSHFARPFVSALQSTLKSTPLGRLFFSSVATPRSVRNILMQCYSDKSAVTDELVHCILQPGLEPGAVDVFLDFICYSGGPLPEEQLPHVQCPVVIAWGQDDPWEPIHLGRALGEISTVQKFIELPGVGHCPHDEAPHLVNPLLEEFIREHS